MVKIEVRTTAPPHILLTGCFRFALGMSGELIIIIINLLSLLSGYVDSYYVLVNFNVNVRTAVYVPTYVTSSTSGLRYLDFEVKLGLGHIKILSYKGLPIFQYRNLS